MLKAAPTIARYSIENYLLDPFVVFGLLLDAGMAPPVPGVTITRGDGAGFGRSTLSAFNRLPTPVRLVPNDLADLMHSLQK
jgi:hypothetical protein